MANPLPYTLSLKHLKYVNYYTCDICTGKSAYISVYIRIIYMNHIKLDSSSPHDSRSRGSIRGREANIPDFRDLSSCSIFIVIVIIVFIRYTVSMKLKLPTPKTMRTTMNILASFRRSLCLALKGSLSIISFAFF